MLITRNHRLLIVAACASVVVVFSFAPGALADTPIALHPENPRYFLFRGRPAFLITSGEHYGAVLNREFDFIRYLDELRACRFNLTRLFSGTYREVAGSFQIRSNTLAPWADRYVAPWARSREPGAADGGNKFDLSSWNPVYFAQLKDFIAAAGARGIVVELVLFCPLYEENLWAINPMNAANNVNGLGTLPRTEVYTLKHPTMVAAHEKLVSKLVTELHGFDNLYYEICNEPSQLTILRDFMNDLDFIHMKPDRSVIKWGIPDKASAQVLALPGRTYAMYLSGGISADLVVELPAGWYRAEWVNPRTGAIDKAAEFDHKGGQTTLTSPRYDEDIALRIVCMRR
jgi:hypothetical protein